MRGSTSTASTTTINESGPDRSTNTLHLPSPIDIALRICASASGPRIMPITTGAAGKSKRRMRELVRHLLHNAAKNTRDDSRLAITMARDSQHVALTIVDSSPRMQDQQERLFQPFAARAPARELQRGAGLGLAICHEIVVSLGGSIALDNRARRAQVVGLDATVRLPLTDNPPR